MSKEQQHYTTADSIGVMRTDTGRLIPRIRPENAEFWKSCKDHKLKLQRCNNCLNFWYYPAPICRWCQSRSFEWTLISGKGVVYSYSWVYRASPGFEDQVPYAYALVELEEGPVMPTNVLAERVSDLSIGVNVTLDYLDLTDDITLPIFRIQ
jgi:uncharacterized OB-fold protein